MQHWIHGLHKQRPLNGDNTEFVIHHVNLNLCNYFMVVPIMLPRISARIPVFQIRSRVPNANIHTILLADELPRSSETSCALAAIEHYFAIDSKSTKCGRVVVHILELLALGLYSWVAIVLLLPFYTNRMHESNTRSIEEGLQYIAAVVINPGLWPWLHIKLPRTCDCVFHCFVCVLRGPKGTNRCCSPPSVSP